MNRQSFSGPLFVVGMPRSGTKLLRGLLNQHPLIRIDTTESDFLPYWINHWESYGDLSSNEAFSAFYRQACKLAYMRKKQAQGVRIDCMHWHDNCRSYDPAGVFEALIKYHTNFDEHPGAVWGDKTPSYIAKTQMLKDIYPDARFIHIVRDVRDFCLSINRAWHKNVYRAAQRWSDDVMSARRSGRSHGDYMEIKYEDLLDNSEAELRRACQFLNLDYSPGMEQLEASVEKIGDAKGAFVDQDNKAKYKTKMDPKVREKIERIARDTLLEFDYPVNVNKPAKRVSLLGSIYYQIWDGCGLIREKNVQTFTDVITNANKQK